MKTRTVVWMFRGAGVMNRGPGQPGRRDEPAEIRALADKEENGSW